jgi:hypothetical protein
MGVSGQLHGLAVSSLMPTGWTPQQIWTLCPRDKNSLCSCKTSSGHLTHSLFLFWLLSNCQAKWIRIVISFQKKINEVTVLYILPFIYWWCYSCLFFPKAFQYSVCIVSLVLLLPLPCRIIIPCFFFLTDKKHFWKDKTAEVYTVWLARRVQYFGRW